MKFGILVLLVALGAVAWQADAQGIDAADMSEEQILERFNKQKTRGLSIAPAAGDVQTSDAPVAAAEPDVGTTIGFDPLPPEEQVNINISFDFDSAALRDDQKPKLRALCRVMSQIDVEVFRILGHTDSAGSEEYNERLSRLRAEEVKRYLVSDCGIAPERLQPVGVGERAPIVPEDPAADANRRVEFQVIG